jgi:hypothetical protein
MDKDDYLELKTWDEIISRERYRRDIDPKSTKLVEIIGHYYLRDDRVTCGLKDCHQPHDRGFLVVTDAGAETNIGNVCGVRHFDIDFKTLRNQFNRQVMERSRRMKLREIFARKDHLLERISELRLKPHGADWLRRSLSSFARLYPHELQSQISERARRENDVVTMVRERSREEIERLKAGNLSTRDVELRYETVLIGRIKGLSIWSKDIRQIVVIDLEQRLYALSRVDVDGLSGKELRAWYQWATKIDGLISEAEALIKAGQEFFAAENLQLLHQLPLRDSIKEGLSRIRWDYAAGDGVMGPRKVKLQPQSAMSDWIEDD